MDAHAQLSASEIHDLETIGTRYYKAGKYDSAVYIFQLINIELHRADTDNLKYLLAQTCKVMNDSVEDAIKIGDYVKAEMYLNDILSINRDDQHSVNRLKWLRPYINILSKEMVFVKGGKYYPTPGDSSEIIDLSSFYMDKTEVTYAQYVRFLNARKPDETLRKLWIDISDNRIYMVGEKYYTDTAYEKMPVVMVSWAGASEYASYYGKDLPTDKQWEYAALGGIYAHQHSFPKAFDVTDKQLQKTILGMAWYKHNSKNGPHKVCESKANALQIYDMLGNVWEWCDNWLPTNVPNPLDTALHQGTYYKHIKGGSYISPISDLNPRTDNFYQYGMYMQNIGFRCVYNISDYEASLQQNTNSLNRE